MLGCFVHLGGARVHPVRNIAFITIFPIVLWVFMQLATKVVVLFCVFEIYEAEPMFDLFFLVHLVYESDAIYLLICWNRYDQRMGMELILLMSMRAPWKARFFSLPFVFLNASPLVSLSLSYPNCPQWSAYCPNLALAWKELSFSSSLIGPTSSILILENDFLGPLSTSLGYLLYYFCGLNNGISSFFFGGRALATTSSYSS